MNPIDTLNADALTSCFTRTFAQGLPFALGVLVVAVGLGWGIDTIKSFVRGGAPSSGGDEN